MSACYSFGSHGCTCSRTIYEAESCTPSGRVFDVVDYCTGDYEDDSIVFTRYNESGEELFFYDLRVVYDDDTKPGSVRITANRYGSGTITVADEGPAPTEKVHELCRRIMIALHEFNDIGVDVVIE